jgi:heme-degrading monooxygenase HmoA
MPMLDILYLALGLGVFVLMGLYARWAAHTCREAHELISYSEWATEADIELYRNSNAHKEIVKHARSLKGSKAVVKLYDLVE